MFNECLSRINASALSEVVRKAAESLADDLGINPILKDYVINNITHSIIEYRSNYAIIRGDADNIGKLSRGEISMSNYGKLFNELMKFTNDNKLVRAYCTLSKLVNELGALITSPTYLAALSMALVATSLKDIYVANYRYYIKSGMNSKPYTSLIFRAGDDVLTLAPTKLGLRLVKEFTWTY